MISPSSRGHPVKAVRRGEATHGKASSFDEEDPGGL